MYNLFYKGEKLKWSPLRPIGLDTETTVEENISRDNPQMVVGIISDGKQNIIFPAYQILDVILSHPTAHWVGHNIPFDFWVIVGELDRLWDEKPVLRPKILQAKEIWFQTCDEGRLHDTQFLEMLVRLAQGKGESRADDNANIFYPANLAQLSKRYGKLKLDKKDPYRMRYGELLPIPPHDWKEKVDPGFWEYAWKDGYATWEIWPKLYQEAKNLLQPYREHCYPDCVERFGILTETIQVQGAIALLKCSRNGIAVDQKKAKIAKEAYRTKIIEIDHWFQAHHPDLFKYKEKKPTKKDLGPHPRYRVLTKKGLPSFSNDYLRSQLEKIAKKHEIEIPRSAGKQKLVSITRADWIPHRHLDPFIDNWINSSELSKLYDFFKFFEEAAVYCRYLALKRTGRVSCSDPNLQQVPARKEFRELFVARPGHKILTIDYSGIELRALAAICKRRYGKSILAQLYERNDPFDDAHSYTASILFGMEFEEFLSWKEDPEKRSEWKSLRQKIKAFNFGIPGGMGWRSLQHQAKTVYGVALTNEEAEDFRRRIIDEVYPELKEYLHDTTLPALATSLGAPIDYVEELIHSVHQNVGMTLRCLVKLSKGITHNVEGKPWSKDFLRSMWDCLENLLSLTSNNRPRSLLPTVRKREHHPDAFQILFSSTATTLTGRIRAGLYFTQAKNTPFQGITADGAKLGIWRLVREGYRFIGFIHDEALVELPEETAEQDALKIKKLLEEAMEEVFDHQVPVSTEYSLTNCWQK